MDATDTNMLGENDDNIPNEEDDYDDEDEEPITAKKVKFPQFEKYCILPNFFLICLRYLRQYKILG